MFVNRSPVRQTDSSSTKSADKRFPKGHSVKPALRCRVFAYQPSCRLAHDLKLSADQGWKGIDPFLPADLGRFSLKEGSSGVTNPALSCLVR